MHPEWLGLFYFISFGHFSMYVYKRQKLIMRDINYGGNQILTWAQPAKIY